MRRFRKHLTYANVMSTLLMFLVLGGGGAYALSGRNTVFSDDIVDGQVKSADLGNGAVTSAKVKDGSLGPADVHAIVTRLGGTGDVSTASGGPVDYPLQQDSWTQPGNEVDIVWGQVSYTTPADCGNGQGNGYGDGSILVYDGAKLLATTTLSPLPASSIRTSGLASSFLFEPGTATSHTLTAQISSACAAPSGEFLVHSVKLDVIAYR